MCTRIEPLIALVVASVCLGGARQPKSPAQTLQEQLRIVEQAIEQRQYRDALQCIGTLQQHDTHRRISRLEQAYLTHLRARTLHRLRREDLRQECIALWEPSRPPVDKREDGRCNALASGRRKDRLDGQCVLHGLCRRQAT